MVDNFSYRVLPGICVLCRERTGRALDLCLDCERELPWLQRACFRCALPITSGDTCGNCLKKPPPFVRTHALWRYEFPINQMITAFKHRRRFDHGHLLMQLWQRRMVMGELDFPELLVPVPLHWRRRLLRGFNQSEFISESFCKHMNINVFKGVNRTVYTPPQQKLTAVQRRKNLRSAFALKAHDLPGKHVAIVDDVVTTGATVQALTDILMAAGARRVDVWCLARTP